MELKRNLGDLLERQLLVQEKVWRLRKELRKFEADAEKKIETSKLEINAYIDEYNVLEIQMKKVYEKYYRGKDDLSYNCYKWKGYETVTKVNKD